MANIPANALNITATGIVKFDGTATFTATTVTQNAVIVGGASNALASTTVGATGQVLQGNTAAAPTYSTATFPSTATGTGTILRADGTNWVATTATYPATTTSQQILYSSATNVVGQVTAANSAVAATNSSGTLAMRALSVVSQIFTSSGTYTPTTGMLYCVIECVGSGGGGGGTATASVSNLSLGAGGGGGGYSRKVSSASTVGASQTVTVGAAGTGGSSGANAGAAGNDVSVGTICVGKGGAGGGGNTGSSVPFGGVGGVAGTGDFTVVGQNGIQGTTSAITVIQSVLGIGGMSALGFGFPGGPTTSTPQTGVAAQLYGAGGGGGSSFSANGAAAGGAGSKGIVVITEYVIN